ncbi:hypothetical protein Tco_1061773 [Tanacetum coccineum]
MERGFLSQKGVGVGRGVKEKDLNRNKKSTSSGISVSTDSEDNMNDDTLVGIASAVQEGVTPSVVDMAIDMGKQNSLDDTTVPEYFAPLSTSVTTTAGNAPGKSSYANITGKSSGKKVNVRTFFTPGGNGINVVVPVDSIRAISERFANTAYGFFLGGRKWHTLLLLTMLGILGVNMGLFAQCSTRLQEDVSTVSVWVKLYSVHVMAFSEDGLSAIATKLSTPLMLDSYTSDMCLQSWGRCSSCKVFGHIHEECPKNTGAGEKKTVKKPSQTSRVVIRRRVRNLLLRLVIQIHFDVLNSTDNDVEFGTNGGTTNLVNNGATSSGSSFMNVDNSSSSTTPIIVKIGKFEDLLTSGQAILVNKEDNPLNKVEFPGADDSEDEVASVDNDMTRSLAYERCFGTQSLLEQWRDSYGNGDYDDDPYDEDMYEGEDLSHEL